MSENIANAAVASALHAELDNVRSSTPGSRHMALSDAAFNVGRLVGEGKLARQYATDTLVRLGEEIGLTFVTSHVNEGIQRGINDWNSRGVPTDLGNKNCGPAGDPRTDTDLGDDCDGDMDGYDGGYSEAEKRMEAARSDMNRAVAAKSAPFVGDVVVSQEIWRDARVGPAGELSDYAKAGIIIGLRTAATAVNRTATQHGWWDEGMPGQTVGEKFMLIVSEVAEALESDRNHEPPIWFKHKGFLAQGDQFSQESEYQGALGKPEGACVELADAIIRILDWCAEKDWPIAAALVYKHNYNQTREHRHGGKAY